MEINSLQEIIERRANLNLNNNELNFNNINKIGNYKEKLGIDNRK